MTDICTRPIFLKVSNSLKSLVYFVWGEGWLGGQNWGRMEEIPISYQSIYMTTVPRAFGFALLGHIQKGISFS